MQFKKFLDAKLIAAVLATLLHSTRILAQGLIVDQASGTTSEFIQDFTRIPDNQIAQSFTPSLSAVGFVQFSEYISAFPGNDQVTFVVNLRQGAYNGPILSSTDPVILVNKITQIGTFYYPDNVVVTPGQLYFFEPVLLSAGSMDIGYKSSSTYAGGYPFINGGPSGPGDFWFREGIVVPEPGAVWLFMFGGAVFLWRRRINVFRTLSLILTNSYFVGSPVPATVTVQDT